MAQLVLGAAGAAVGFALGGMVGAQAGWVIGATIGGLVDPQRTHGPRLSDLKVQNSSYGATEPLAYGGVRIAGNVIWSTNLTEHEQSGGGKGGPSVTNYTYSVSCAVNICAGPQTGLRRIWADSKLVYDATSTATTEESRASAEFATFFEFYSGSEIQSPDPTIEAAVGAGNAPAYRGSCYIVFTDLPLQDYGNRIPSFSFELSTEPAGETADPPSGIANVYATTDLSPATLGIINVSWTAATGADYYDVYRSKDEGSFAKLNVTPVTATTFEDNTTLNDEGADCIGSVYTYQVIAVNGSGTTASRLRAVRWYGTFNGSGHYLDNAMQPPICIDWWGENTGYGAPGFGNTCFKYGEGTDQVSSYFGFDDLGTTEATAAAGATVGIVDAGSVLLSDIVQDVCVRCGLDVVQIDVTALTDMVDGFVIGQQMTGRSAIEPLRSAYWFDAVESGDEIRFVKRGAASAVSIGPDDLGAAESQADDTAVVPQRAQETDLPARVNVVYMARSRDFESGTQSARRMTTGSQQISTAELPVVMSDLKAAQVADVLLYDAWTARSQRTWATTRKFAKYEPTDVVTLDDGEFTYTVRVTGKSEEGPVIKWRGVDDSAAAYSPHVTAAGGSSSSSVPLSGGATALQLMDIPALRDEDAAVAGYYAAACGTLDGWTGARYYRSLDGGSTYGAVDDFTTEATIGMCLSVLGDYTGGNTIDEASVVRVRLTAGTLASTTHALLLAGANMAVIGSELVQFKRAELVEADTYLLSGLLRGRRGTEQYISTHGVFEAFVLLDSPAVHRETDALSLIGSQVYAKGVTYGQAIAVTAAQTFTDTGVSLKPLSVVHLQASDAGGGDYAVQWVRRSRIGGEWRDNADTPLGETTEQYRVDVERSAAVISTATVTAPTATVAAEAGDIVRVYQISELVGSGFPAETTIA